MAIIITCPDCGASLQWELARVGAIAMLMSKCRHCSPDGAWHHEPVEILRKPRGKAGLWPTASDAPLAPVDDPNAV